MASKLISIVVPMYFEEKVAEESYNRLTKMARDNSLNYEIIFVNDGSTDRTLDILEGLAQRDNNIKVISFSRNFGHQIAITAGMDRASGDAVVVIDADLQDPPELIPDMIKLWMNGYDVVYAKRKKREGESWFKLITAKMFYRILDRMSSVKIPVDTGDFRLMDRKVVEALKRMPEQNRFVRGMISWIGFKQIPLEYERKERYAGETKYPLKKMIKFALDGIVSFSDKPLKFIERIGIFAIVISMAVFLLSIMETILGRNFISGIALIVAAVVFMGGVQLVFLGIIGEYIARIYDQSKGRPLYIVDREINMNAAVNSELNIRSSTVEEEYQKKVG